MEKNNLDVLIIAGGVEYEDVKDVFKLKVGTSYKVRIYNKSKKTAVVDLSHVGLYNTVGNKTTVVPEDNFVDVGRGDFVVTRGLTHIKVVAHFHDEEAKGFGIDVHFGPFWHPYRPYYPYPYPYPYYYPVPAPQPVPVPVPVPVPPPPPAPVPAPQIATSEAPAESVEMVLAIEGE